MEQNTKEKRYWKIFTVFFKIGLITIGGGLAMLPVMQEEFCKKACWISEDEMLDVIARPSPRRGLSPAIPPPSSDISSAASRAMVAVAGAALPSFLINLLVAAFYTSIDQNTR